MGRSVTIDDRHFQFIAERARERGQTAEQYLESLIDIDARTFDEILAPVRKGFENTSDDELEEMWERARKATRTNE